MFLCKVIKIGAISRLHAIQRQETFQDLPQPLCMILVLWSGDYVHIMLCILDRGQERALFRDVCQTTRYLGREESLAFQDLGFCVNFYFYPAQDCYDHSA